VVKVAVTGNYGSGKSFVLKLFKELGAFTVSADDLVEELLANCSVQEKIREIAGNGMFDCRKDLAAVKEKLAELIFSDPEMRRRIEDIIHPLVLYEIESALLNVKADVAVIEVPLLFERGYESRFDKSVAVFAREETAMKRLEKAGIPRSEAIRRLAAQMPLSDKVKKADYVINNDGPAEETKKQVKKIFREVTALRHD
jgi:dephospho-CoA kinase